MVVAPEHWFKRNHYNEAQRSMVGAKLKSLFEEQAKKRQQAAGGDKKSYEASVTQELKSVPVNLPGLNGSCAGTLV